MDQRFVLHKLSAGRNVSGPGVGTGMQCLDERQLSLLFAKKSGAAKLTSTAFPPMQHDVATAGSGAVDQLVVALCNAGRLHDALSLAIACARSAAGNSAASSSSPDNNTSFSAYLLSAPIIALSKQCLVGGRSPASVASASQRDFFLHAPFLAGCVPSDKAAAEEDSEGRHQWRYLCALLSSLRRADHCGGVHVYEVALRALLFFHKQQSAPTSDAPLPLPRTLVDALAGLPSPVSVNADNTDSCSRAGDPSLLLRLLLEFDCREEACSLATRLLSAANDELLQGPAPRSVSVAVAAADTSVQDLCGWLPYPTLDLLIAHCELPHECSSPELLKRERDALVKLKDTLEQHFSLWLFR